MRSTAVIHDQRLLTVDDLIWWADHFSLRFHGTAGGHHVAESQRASCAAAHELQDSGTVLSADDGFRKRIDQNRAFLERCVAEGSAVYGVTSGFGNSSDNRIDPTSATDLQRNLYTYHGCGAGPYLSAEDCAAALLVRLNCLARGYSGVSFGLLEALANLLHCDIIPALPSLGSVGASGDLTPLSYVAAVLAGERTCYYRGSLAPANEVLQHCGVQPYAFKPKEALAVMNGTSVMTAIAIRAWHDARQIALHASLMTGLLAVALGARKEAFSDRLHRVKPHPGQGISARFIASLFQSAESSAPGSSRARSQPDRADQQQNSDTADGRLQDSYSIRCAPHVIGVLYDVLDWSRKILEIEMNSANDNPVIETQGSEPCVLNGGHFFGGHVAAVADALKTATANVLGLLDKQLAILIDRRLNGGRFAHNLVATHRLGARAAEHHGLKALQITMSALTAEALKTSLPMSIFSRSTESLNQDVVSMGTIAARDLRAVCDLGKTTVACYSIALRQAWFLAQDTGARGDEALSRLSEPGRTYLGMLEQSLEPVLEDRALDGEISAMAHRLFSKEVYERFGQQDGQ